MQLAHSGSASSGSASSGSASSVVNYLGKTIKNIFNIIFYRQTHIDNEPFSYNISWVKPVGHLRVASVGFSHDGKYAVTGSENVKIWSVETGYIVNTLAGHNSYAMKVAFSPDDKYIAVIYEDGFLKTWKTSTWNWHSVMLTRFDSISGLAFSADSKFICTRELGNGTLKIWSSLDDDLEEVKHIQQHTRPTEQINYLAFSHNGKNIAAATGYHDGTSSNLVKIWSVDTGDLIWTLSCHNNYVRSVTFSPDDRFVVSASLDQSMKVWSMETGEIVHILTGGSTFIGSVAFTPDGKYIAVGSDDASIKIISTLTYKTVSTYKDADKNPIIHMQIAKLDAFTYRMGIWTCDNLKIIIVTDDANRKPYIVSRLLNGAMPKDARLPERLLREIEGF